MFEIYFFSSILFLGKTYSLMSDTGITRSLIDRCFDHIQKDLKHSYKVFGIYTSEKLLVLMACVYKHVKIYIRLMYHTCKSIKKKYLTY